MAIAAIHKITGQIALVSEGLLAANENLERASKEQIAQVQKEREIRVYGTTLAPSGELPAEVLGEPHEGWSKAELIAYAEHHKIDVDKSNTKAELLKAFDAEGAN